MRPDLKIFALLFVAGLGVFAAFSNARLKIHSTDNHFVYLADSFLNGQLDLTRPAPHHNDWASYQVLSLKGESAQKYGDTVKGGFTRRKGKPNEFRTLDKRLIEIPRKDRGQSTKKTYVSFPPMPAVLMLPAVAAVGYGANDVLFTVIFAALNLPLAWLLLMRLRKQGHIERAPSELIWLAALLAIGSAHLWCGIMGKVWFTALIVGVTFHLLYLYFAIDTRRPLLAGLCLAFAFATRASLVFSAAFFFFQLLWPSEGERKPWPELAKKAAWFCAPCLVVGVLLLMYNAARFGSPAEFGHTWLAGGHLPRIRDFGLFDPVFLNRNLTAAFTLLPRFQDSAPYIIISKHGMSIFASTPALLYLIWPARKHPVARAAGLTAACVGIPILFYQNTGWIQFSYRFVLDVMPLFLLCLALGGRQLTRTFKVLIVVGVLVNAFGAATFERKVGKPFYGEFMTEEPRK